VNETLLRSIVTQPWNENYVYARNFDALPLARSVVLSKTCRVVDTATTSTVSLTPSTVTPSGKCQTPLHGHRLRTPPTDKLKQVVDVVQHVCRRLNLLYNILPATDMLYNTTNRRAHNNSTTCSTTDSPPTDKNLPHRNIWTCRDVGIPWTTRRWRFCDRSLRRSDPNQLVTDGRTDRQTDRQTVVLCRTVKIKTTSYSTNALISRKQGPQPKGHAISDR